MFGPLLDFYLKHLLGLVAVLCFLVLLGIRYTPPLWSFFSLFSFILPTLPYRARRHSSPFPFRFLLLFFFPLHELRDVEVDLDRFSVVFLFFSFLVLLPMNLPCPFPPCF